MAAAIITTTIVQYLLVNGAYIHFYWIIEVKLVAAFEVTGDMKCICAVISLIVATVIAFPTEPTPYGVELDHPRCPEADIHVQIALKWLI